MCRRKDPEAQASLWLSMQKLPKASATAFWQRLDRALAASRFGDAVRELCESYYEMDGSRGGRPGIDAEVCFKIKMQMVGFFEEIGSELGVDALVLEANASMRSLKHRLTGEDYWSSPGSVDTPLFR